MGFSSARGEGRPRIYGPDNVWALSAWGIRAEGRLDVPGPAGGWVFFPFEVLWSSRLAMGVGPRPMVPTNVKSTYKFQYLQISHFEIHHFVI